MIRRLLAASLVLGLWSTQVSAQQCGGAYVIQRGDSLSRIAASTYRNAFRWTQIYQANLGTIGPDPDKILVGQKIDLPCVNGLPQRGPQTETVEPVPAPKPDPLTVEFLALSGFPPFADRNLPSGGMIAELLEKASENAEAGPYEMRAVRELSLAATTKNAVPVSFPWVVSDCALFAEVLCDKAILSDPMFEVLVTLFARADEPFSLRAAEDIAGTVICSASDGAAVYLDADGRNWIADNLAELRIEASTPQCFQALMAGAVDAVVINEFTGRYVARDMGIEDHVQALIKTPLGISMVYAAVPRTAPRAEEAIDFLNEGLRGLRASGGFQMILDRHLSTMWQGS